MHEAAVIVAMQQVEQMTHLMKGDLGHPFQDPVGRW
jgi:hypothetical protein